MAIYARNTGAKTFFTERIVPVFQYGLRIVLERMESFYNLTLNSHFRADQEREFKNIDKYDDCWRC